MSIRLPLFFFQAEALGIDEQRDYVARLPTSLRDREALFTALKHALGLPEYFGRNWDALSECLRDLSWIKQHRVILLHEDLPQLDPKTLKVYLDVLSECIEDWKPSEEHQLIVVFPEDATNAMAQLLGQ